MLMLVWMGESWRGHKRRFEGRRDLSLKDGKGGDAGADEGGVVAQLLPRDVRRGREVHDVAHGLCRDVLLAHAHGLGARLHRPFKTKQNPKRTQKKRKEEEKEESSPNGEM